MLFASPLMEPPVLYTFTTLKKKFKISDEHELQLLNVT